jgi:hypothetical protein
MLGDTGRLANRPIRRRGSGDHDFGTSENEIVRAAGVQRRALS